jgi:hypothetical protein
MDVLKKNCNFVLGRPCEELLFYWSSNVHIYRVLTYDGGAVIA